MLSIENREKSPKWARDIMAKAISRIEERAMKEKDAKLKKLIDDIIVREIGKI
jgi:hypothetical protein